MTISVNASACSYGQRKPSMAKAFEFTRKKEVVCECINPTLGGIHEVHVLTTNGEPVS